jgi:hypothetical protein
VSVVNCRTYQITGDAVVVEDSHEISIVGNTFSWHTEAGMTLRRVRWGTVTGNNIIDTGSINPGGPFDSKRFADLGDYPPSYAGIALEACRGLTVTGNALFNWPVCPPMSSAIDEDDESANNVIVGNNANYYREQAVRSAGTQTVAESNSGYATKPLWFNPPPEERGESLFIDTGHPVQSFQPELTRGFIDRGYDNPSDGDA